MFFVRKSSGEVLGDAGRCWEMLAGAGVPAECAGLLIASQEAEYCFQFKQFNTPCSPSGAADCKSVCFERIV